MPVQENLGIAGNITSTFINSPITPLLLVACLVMGILGLYMSPRQEDPQISVPMVDIFFQYPGASAEQVASLAADPLERMMAEIPGVKHVYSASQQEMGMVTVRFKVGENMETSLVKLYDKLASNMDKIPPGVSEPLVKPKSVDDVPIVTLTLWSKDVDDAAMRMVAHELLQRLKGIPNTSQSFVVGGRQEMMRVEVQPQRLKGFGITLGKLASTIRSANKRHSAGSAEVGSSAIKVYTGGFLKHAQDIERLVVGVSKGSPVYVRDVANVIEGPGEAENIVQYYTGPSWTEDKFAAPNGAAAVTIAIAKKIGTNGVTVADDILNKVESLKGAVIPDNIHVAVTRNYGLTASDKVNELIMSLLEATGFVTILIFLFLGLRPTFVVATVIPIIVLVTIFAAWIMGFTIDRVSLFALIFSIGILVDDATVVVENIYRRWLANDDVTLETTIDAVREVGNPTILATLTIIAALIPMGLVSGMMGPYMRPIPILGSVAMSVSLFAAFIFTPWLAIRIKPSLDKLRKMEEREHRDNARIDRFFRWLLTPLLETPWKGNLVRLAIVFGLLGACFMFYTTHVRVKMLPLDNKPEFNIVVDLPEGTSLPITANIINTLGKKVLELEEVVAVQTYSGTASPFNFNGLVRHYYLRQLSWNGDIQVQLTHKDDRDRTSHDIAVAARAMLTPLAKELGAKIAVVEMPPGPPVLQTMVAEVYGPDNKVRRQVAEDLTRIFEKSEIIVDVDNYLQEPHKIWRFVVNGEKAERRGVSIESVNTQLGMIMGGHKLGDAKIGNELEPRYIVLQAPLNIRGEPSQIGEVPVRASDGKLIPISELGRFEEAVQDEVIYHKDLRPVEYVVGEVSGRLAAPVYAMIEVSKLLDDYVTPDGVKLSGYLIGAPPDNFQSAFEWTGEWTVTYETFRDMGIAFMAALVLIYMLVVWEFGNFRQPGIIMAPIPLTLIGIIPGHWLLNAEFTATSMIGWIALAGIIVRNSILLVDFAKHAIMDGVDRKEAVIQAVKTRTRPILITQLTMIAGSSTILGDQIFQGMAISLMFGAMVSTLLTLVVIPLSCMRSKKGFLQEMIIGGLLPEDATSANDRPVGAASEGPGLFAKIMGALSMGFYLLRAIVMMAWMGLKALFAKLGSLGPVFSMVLYALRALPYFLWMMIKEAGKGIGGLLSGSGGSQPAPAAATPAPQSYSGASSASSPVKSAKKKKLKKKKKAKAAKADGADKAVKAGKAAKADKAVQAKMQKKKKKKKAKKLDGQATGSEAALTAPPAAAIAAPAATAEKPAKAEAVAAAVVSAAAKDSTKKKKAKKAKKAKAAAKPDGAGKPMAANTDGKAKTAKADGKAKAVKADSKPKAVKTEPAPTLAERSAAASVSSAPAAPKAKAKPASAKAKPAKAETVKPRMAKAAPKAKAAPEAETAPKPKAPTAKAKPASKAATPAELAKAADAALTAVTSKTAAPKPAAQKALTAKARPAAKAPARKPAVTKAAKTSAKVAAPAKPATAKTAAAKPAAQASPAKTGTAARKTAAKAPAKAPAARKPAAAKKPATRRAAASPAKPAAGADKAAPAAKATTKPATKKTPARRAGTARRTGRRGIRLKPPTQSGAKE